MALKEYQARLFSDGNAMCRRIEMVCNGDKAAREQAQKLIEDGQMVELWAGPLLVARFVRPTVKIVLKAQSALQSGKTS